MNKLTIVSRQGKTIIMLDDLELKGVKAFEVKSSAGGTTELSIKLDTRLSELILN